MELKTVDRQPVRVACLRYTGPFGPAIGEFWRDDVQPWLVANQLNVSTYGLALDLAGSTPWLPSRARPPRSARRGAR